MKKHLASEHRSWICQPPLPGGANQFCRRELPPLKSSAFSRRILSPSRDGKRDETRVISLHPPDSVIGHVQVRLRSLRVIG